MRLYGHQGRDLLDTGTGEHGVGLGKKKFLVEELGESTVDFMKHLKQSIDPLNLFNPGKVRGISRGTLCGWLITSP